MIAGQRAFFSKSANATVVVEAKRLQVLCSAILQKSGSSVEESDAVSQNLVLSNLKGHDSHGVGYLPRYIRASLAGDVTKNGNPEITKNGCFVNVDGMVAYGQVVGKKAMNAGIESAREHGVSIVTVKNSHHLGRIGAWAEQAVSAGFSSIHFTNVAGHTPLVAPANGADARLGTNPVTIGFSINKSGEAPLIMDYATSELALGKVRETMARSETLKDGVVLDKDGKKSNDPSVMFTKPQGSLLSFSEHKGYALALMAEFFGGVLSGGNTIHPKYKRHDEMILNSMTTVIFSPEALMPETAGNAEQEVEDLKQYMRDSPLRDDRQNDAVLIPGELEQQAFEHRSVHGIPLAKGTYEDLMQVAKEVNMSKAESKSLLFQSL